MDVKYWAGSLDYQASQAAIDRWAISWNRRAENAAQTGSDDSFETASRNWEGSFAAVVL